MKATDARRYSPSQLEVLRERAFEMRNKGYTVASIADALGVSMGTVFKWQRNAKRGTQEQAIKGGQRGRKPDQQKALSPEQQKHICSLICDKSPNQLKFDFALWTRRAVRALIKREYALELTPQCVGKYLKSWGMTSQRPSHRAIERDDDQIKQWLEISYPEIAKRAKTEGAIIYWSDETAIKHDCNWVSGYSPCGKTPILKCHDGRWTSATMVSAVSNQGLLRFKIQDKPMTKESFVEFLEDMIKDEPKKIFMIVDNLRVHKSKLVNDWVEAHKERIELFFLPPYAPELNPDEYVNRSVKTEIRSRAPTKTTELKKRVQRFMQKMSRKATFIRKIFENENVAYAAV